MSFVVVDLRLCTMDRTNGINEIHSFIRGCGKCLVEIILVAILYLMQDLCFSLNFCHVC